MTNAPSPVPSVEEALKLADRLRSPLPVCPFDRKSPHYWTAGEDGKPCFVCGQTENGPDICRGADTRCMTEAADFLTAQSALLAEAVMVRDEYLAQLAEQTAIFEEVRKVIKDGMKISDPFGWPAWHSRAADLYKRLGGS